MTEMNEEKTIEIQACIIHCIYQTEDKAWSVLSCESRHGRRFVAVGNGLPDNAGLNVLFKGQFVENKKFGRQLAVERWEEIIPKTTDGIREYLYVAKIRHIGKVTADKIVAMYGERSIEMLEDATALSRVNGISMTKAVEIVEDYRLKKQSRELIMALNDFGISPKKAPKIEKKFRASALKVANERPYLLTFIEGISMGRIDTALIQKKKFNPADKDRLTAAMHTVFMMNEARGHLFISPEDFVQGVYGMVNQDRTEDVSKDVIRAMINRKVKTGSIRYFGGKLYTKKAYEAETEAAEALIPFIENEGGPDVTEQIEKFEAKSKMQYSKTQKEAVRFAFTHGLSIITGGPGCGKTTTTNLFLDICEYLFPQDEILLCAPTGRAARRLTESTGRAASTIHKALSLRDEDDEPTEELTADWIVADEMSMCDQFLAATFFSHIKPGAHIILVGDVNQLPSVRAGNVLRELINSKRIATTWLDKVFRQGEGSSIIDNSESINDGEMSTLRWDNESCFIKSTSPERTLQNLLDVVAQKRIKKEDDDIQILTPFKKKTILGADNLNLVIQKIMNPPGNGKMEVNFHGHIWRTGDRVMNTKNEERDEASMSNGDIGKIIYVDKATETMRIAYNFGTKIAAVEYPFSEIEERLMHAYAVTIHKSQGSEYPDVIIPLTMEHKGLLQRNLLYTGVTRAKENITLIGEKEALAYAVSNDTGRDRNTYLAARIVMLLDRRKDGKAVFTPRPKEKQDVIQLELQFS